MASDRSDGDYLGAYRRFLVDFLETMNPDDKLPVKMSGYDLTEGEIVGEIIDVTLQYLNQKYCPPSLQSHMVRLVVEEIKSICKEHPEDCGWKPQEKTYAPLNLMYAVTKKVNEICLRYLDNSRLALLPPPPSTPFPLAAACAIKNSRRKMEDRHVILHDLHTLFGIQDDSTASYYAVFDGHAGQDAAAYCSAHLHQYLAESIHYPTDPVRALRDAFLTTDARFLEKSEKQKSCSGTTVVCALLRSKKLYVAWVGDSQAILSKRGEVTQLVDPHKPSRNDEKERIQDMGGAVVHHGTWRVNGYLAVSRAIGDVQYKPYVTGDPDVRCVNLDGTEDFLVIACDGLWDCIDETVASAIVYRQIYRDPYNLEIVPQSLVQYSKKAGSSDNISVIVVFLTPPAKIAARPSSYSIGQPGVDELAKDMDPNDPFFLSDTSSPFGVNAASTKQQQQQQQRRQTTNGTGHEDEGLFGTNDAKPSNGERANGAGSNDYDDEDLGPETDVDAVDDAAVPGLENVSRELFPEKPGDREQFRPEEAPDDDDDDDDSPPSPHEKPRQHELIAEADNVVDSEDSEDEWNYYRADPDKEKDSAATLDEGRERNDEKVAVDPVPLVQDKDTPVEISSSDIDFGDKSPGDEETRPSEHTETDIRAAEKPEGASTLSQEELDEMDFQLNPNAAEFVPVSPRVFPAQANLVSDYPVSGSPLKRTPSMDDISLPSQKEFNEEISSRPKEMEEKESSNGDHPRSVEFAEYATNDRKLQATLGLDESDVSSTRAEFGDVSSTSFVTAPEFQRTGISVIDDSFSGSEREEKEEEEEEEHISAKYSEIMDLNAVHDLSDTDSTGRENGAPVEGEVVARSPNPESATLLALDSDVEPTTTAADNSNGPSSPLSPCDAMESTLLEFERSHDSAEPLRQVDFEARNLPAPRLEECELPKTAEPKLGGEASPVSDLASKFASPFDVDSALDSQRFSAQSDEKSTMVFDSHDEALSLPRQDSWESRDIVSSTAAANLAEPSVPIESEILSSGLAEDRDAPSRMTRADTTADDPFSLQSFGTGEEREPVVRGLVDFSASPFESRKTPERSITPDVSVLQNPLDLNVAPPVSTEQHTEPPLEVQIAPSDDALLVDYSKEANLTPAFSPVSNVSSTDRSFEDVRAKEKSALNSSTPRPSRDIEDKIMDSDEFVPPIDKGSREELADAQNDVVREIETFQEPIKADDPAEKVVETNACDFGTHRGEAADVVAPVLILSESMQEFTGLERELDPEKIVVPLEGDILCNLRKEETEGESQKSALESTTDAIEPKASWENVPKEILEARQSESTPEKELSAYVPKEMPEIPAIVEPAVEAVAATTASESKPAETTTAVAVAVPAVTAAVGGAVAATTAAVAAKAAKTKPSPKTTKTSTNVKPTLKSTPTSPTKTLGTSTRATATTIAKKPAARPKQLDTSAKSATASTVVPKTSALKPTASARTTTRPSTASPRTKLSSASSKPAATSSTDKKPTTNGDVKASSKTSATLKPASKPPPTNATTTRTQVRPPSMTARTTVSTTSARPRSSTGTATAKTAAVKPATTGTVGTTTQRPKTAPATGTTKARLSTTRSPVTDKQIKETANKQISSSRTTASSTLSKTGRLSTSSTAGTARRVTSAKPLPAASLPTKKPPVTRLGVKSSSVSAKTSAKSTVSSTLVRSKVTQNGVYEEKEAKTTTTTTTTTTTSSDAKEDVPKKDVSPVESPTDNQLIIAAD